MPTGNPIVQWGVGSCSTNTMQIQKLIEGKRDRAVSPVIGVILMVAITVILAAVIGTFVIGLGDNIQTNVQAGASVQDNGQDRITTTFTSAQSSDTYLNVTYEADETVFNSDDNMTYSGRIDQIGGTDTVNLAGHSGPVEVVVTVTAINGDQRTAILSKTVTLNVPA